MCSCSRLRLLARPLVTKPVCLLHVSWSKFRLPPRACQLALLRVTRSAPASSRMVFCRRKLSAPAMLSSLMLPCHWVCSVSPPLAAARRVSGLLSIFRLPWALNWCWRCVPLRLALMLSMAMPLALMWLPLSVMLSGAVGLGLAWILKSRFWMRRASPRAKPWACPLRLASTWV